ncbi:MAG: hypothetical protein KJ057_12975 [Phycisphaerae bacterium]|nr:hypothetical protein [Planctomycetia bacterium]MCL4719377.1 hypothetical protein [Phycisphaerae bacterium]
MTTQTPERLQSGTRVVNTNDGEAGRIVGTLGVDHAGRATSYHIETAYGREVWKAREIVVIEPTVE